jgi:RND family efflux transporter MFP subunit
MSGKKLNFLQVLTPIMVLVLTVVLAVWLVKTKTSPRKKKQPKLVLVVETVTVKKGSHRIIIDADGNVMPEKNVELKPEVSGLIVWKNPNLIPGGIVDEGEVLLRIDKRNYLVAVKQGESALEQAGVLYQIELSRRDIAREEWSMLDVGMVEDSRAKALALRGPQLKAAMTKVYAASNALERARLDMERTEIKAPFNAVVLDEYVDCGQLVSPQARLAALAGTDSFRVELSMPVAELRNMHWPDRNGAGGATVRVFHDLGGGETTEFKGKVIRVLGGLGKVGRMARVLVRVEDPLSLRGDDRKKRLFAGSYVHCLIEGVTVDDTIELPGTLVREGKRVWVMDEEKKLRFRDVDILRRSSGRVLIGGGLNDGERVVSSHIAVPVPGMTLREKGSPVGKKNSKPGKPGMRKDVSDES